MEALARRAGTTPSRERAQQGRFWRGRLHVSAILLGKRNRSPHSSIKAPLTALTVRPEGVGTLFRHLDQLRVVLERFVYGKLSGTPMDRALIKQEMRIAWLPAIPATLSRCEKSSTPA